MRIIARLWCHSAGVIPNVAWPSLADSKGALAHGDTASTGWKDQHTSSIPLEAAMEECRYSKLQVRFIYIKAEMETEVCFYIFHQNIYNT